MSDRGTLTATPPCLVDGCVVFLHAVLTKESTVLQTGCRSGVAWLAKRALMVLAFEHDAFYCGTLRAALKRPGIRNAHIVLDEKYGTHGPRIDGDIMFDLVLVNGIGRTLTVLTTWERVKPGGYLMLDNSQSAKLKSICWYLDSQGWSRVEWCDGPRRTSMWCRPVTALAPQTNDLVH